jgi:hypothetical protein
MVIYSSKHVKDNKLKHKNLSITLDGVLKLLYTFIYIEKGSTSSAPASCAQMFRGFP